MTAGPDSQDMLTLTPSQAQALKHFEEFVDGDAEVFILTGAAGTGKTTALRSFVAALDRRRISYLLTAPTGRAARILTDRVGIPARTVHSAIYSLDSIRVEVPTEAEVQYEFGLKSSDKFETQVIIVDEASMVGDVRAGNEILVFGSGRLLHDLFTYARSGPYASKRKVVFVGDPYQLPPIGSDTSPALDAAYLVGGYSLSCTSAQLSEVVRQRSESGIPALAAHVRECLEASDFTTLRMRRGGLTDVVTLAGADLIESATHIMDHAGDANVVIVVRSNQKALELNRVVRERRYSDADADPRPGDRVVVTQNDSRTGLLNGQFGVIAEVAAEPERRRARDIDLVFRDAVIDIELPDGSSTRYEVKLWEPLLSSRDHAITPADRKSVV